jgi:arginine repressor
VGIAIDRLAWPDVLGNISGDDTIFLAVPDRAAQRRVVAILKRLGAAAPRS